MYYYVNFAMGQINLSSRCVVVMNIVWINQAKQFFENSMKKLRLGEKSIGKRKLNITKEER